MFGSATIDVAIGLVFVYLLLSLAVTAMQELLDSVIKLRAAHLSKGIEKLLGTENAERFFTHPLIRALSPDKWFGEGTRRPSYLPSRTFAMTVLDLIKKVDASAPRTIADVKTAIGTLPDPLKKSLEMLLEEANRDVAEFEAALESWFNHEMDRVAGWYKRKVHVIGMLLALGVTVYLNVDSIAIATKLSNDSALRASLVAEAQALASKASTRPHEGDKSATVSELVKPIQDHIQTLSGLGLSLGRWGKDAKSSWPDPVPGWLITALAISLGAPFWFDTLSKVVSIRSSGRVPDGADK